MEGKYADFEVANGKKTVFIEREKEYGVIVSCGGVTWAVNEERLFNLRDEK